MAVPRSSPVEGSGVGDGDGGAPTAVISENVKDPPFAAFEKCRMPPVIGVEVFESKLMKSLE